MFNTSKYSIFDSLHSQDYRQAIKALVSRLVAGPQHNLTRVQQQSVQALLYAFEENKDKSIQQVPRRCVHECRSPARQTDEVLQ